jgi:general secretion pathway protein C
MSAIMRVIETAVNGRFAVWGSYVVRLAAVGWMAWALAGAVWVLSGQSAARLALPAQPVRQALPDVDVSRLASADFFGAPSAVPATGSAATAPDTSLQLRLTGVFVNSDAAQSSAIIAERNNPSAPAKVYRVNDSLPGGATLAEVYDDRILIRRGGSDEVLRFEKAGSLLQDKAPEVAATGNDWRSMLGSAIQSLSASPEQFMRQMGLKSSAEGYEITDSTPENLRSMGGLSPGDKLISLNGHRLGNPQQDRDVLESLQSANHARIEMKRGGKTIVLNSKL